MNGHSGIIHGKKTTQMLINWWECINKAWYTDWYIIGHYSVIKRITLRGRVWNQSEHKGGKKAQTWVGDLA